MERVPPPLLQSEDPLSASYTTKKDVRNIFRFCDTFLRALSPITTVTSYPYREYNAATVRGAIPVSLSSWN